MMDIEKYCPSVVFLRFLGKSLMQGWERGKEEEKGRDSGSGEGTLFRDKIFLFFFCVSISRGLTSVGMLQATSAEGKSTLETTKDRQRKIFRSSTELYRLEWCLHFFVGNLHFPFCIRHA